MDELLLARGPELPLNFPSADAADTAVARALQGSREDLGAVYEWYYPVILAFVRRRVMDQSLAEDITAQTFVQALQALHRYEERGTPFVVWLQRIAANAIVDQSRRDRWATLAVNPSPNRDEATEEERRASDLLPEEWVHARERLGWLLEHLRTLSPEQRRALWLRFGEGRGVSDVAVNIGRSETATKVLLHRTLKRLRARMRPEASMWV